MARLLYSMLASVDGFVSDESGSFDWAAPDEEVHAAANALEREVGTCLYGRRMYETMAIWDDFPNLDSEPDVVREYAELWQASDKIVFSTTLPGPFTRRTVVERAFDAQRVRALKAEADADISISGPTLAAAALADGLVDDIHLFLIPVVVGGGLPVLPHGVRLGLDLVETRRFASGVVHLHYRTATSD